VVPFTNAVALRPRSQNRDVRLIEIAEGGITINGEPVSGRELRQRVGDDADLILRVSYLSNDDRRTLFERRETVAEAPSDKPQAETPGALGSTRERRRANGDRVRIFGDAVVNEDEEVTGQVVAVLGSVRIDGEVGDQVVAVLGSVDV